MLGSYGEQYCGVTIRTLRPERGSPLKTVVPVFVHIETLYLLSIWVTMNSITVGVVAGVLVVTGG